MVMGFFRNIKREKLFCPHCNKYISKHNDWECPYCEQINGLQGLFPLTGRSFYEPCKRCKKQAAKARCPYCGEVFTLNPEGDSKKIIRISKGFGETLVDVVTQVVAAHEEYQNSPKTPEEKLKYMEFEIGTLRGEKIKKELLKEIEEMDKPPQEPKSQYEQMLDDYIARLEAIRNIDKVTEKELEEAIKDIGKGKPLSDFTTKEFEKFRERKRIIEELARRIKAGR
jgi:hypothetical protein